VIDTHCHLTFPEYEGRVGEILADAREVGVLGAITIATTTRDARRTVALAEAHTNLWASAGVHPLYADEPADWEEMRAAGRSRKCVAWGELGLDRHYADPPQEVQRPVLEAQLEAIARWHREEPALAKPIVLHCREAFDELIPVLRASGLPAERFVFHCFTAGPREMRLLLDAARLAPLDRIMVETDAPFLTPEPYRTVRPNAPKYVVHVAEALAALRGEPVDRVREAVFANAQAFFGVHPTGA
jgi:TatD DNase family protein